MNLNNVYNKVHCIHVYVMYFSFFLVRVLKLTPGVSPCLRKVMLSCCVVGLLVKDSVE